MLGLLTMGVFVLILAAWHNTTGASVGMLGIGVGVIFVLVSAQTLLQGQTPMQMMRRVSSSMMAALSWAQLLGLGLSGSVAQTVGIRRLFFASAVLLALFACIGFLRLPQATTVKAEAATP